MTDEKYLAGEIVSRNGEYAKIRFEKAVRIPYRGEHRISEMKVPYCVLDGKEKDGRFNVRARDLVPYIKKTIDEKLEDDIQQWLQNPEEEDDGLRKPRVVNFGEEVTRAEQKSRDIDSKDLPK